MEYRSLKTRPDVERTRRGPLLGDETIFIRKLLANPRLTGALAPSSPYLARAMARATDAAAADGLIVELGPGTGPVTRALIEHGVAPERLVLVEYDPAFCRMLGQRHHRVQVVQGDAYDLPSTLKEFAGRKIAAFVSSLPLLNQPRELRARLIEDAFEMMGPEGLFVQFSYGVKSPIPKQVCINRYSGRCTAPIWRNLPPARVWSYHADPQGHVSEPMLGKLQDGADRLGEAWRENWQERKSDAERLLRRQRARMRKLLPQEARAMIAAGRLRRAKRDAHPEV